MAAIAKFTLAVRSAPVSPLAESFHFGSNVLYLQQKTLHIVYRKEFLRFAFGPETIFKIIGGSNCTGGGNGDRTTVVVKWDLHCHDLTGTKSAENDNGIFQWSLIHVVKLVFARFKPRFYHVVIPAVPMPWAATFIVCITTEGKEQNSVLTVFPYNDSISTNVFKKLILLTSVSLCFLLIYCGYMRLWSIFKLTLE